MLFVVCPCLAFTIFVSQSLCKHKHCIWCDASSQCNPTNQTTKSSSSTTTAITVATRATGRQMFSVFVSFSSRFFSSSSSYSPASKFMPEVHLHTVLFSIPFTFMIQHLFCACCIYVFFSFFICCSFLSLLFS